MVVQRPILAGRMAPRPVLPPGGLPPRPPMPMPMPPGMPMRQPIPVAAQVAPPPGMAPRVIPPNYNPGFPGGNPAPPPGAPGTGATLNQQIDRMMAMRQGRPGSPTGPSTPPRPDPRQVQEMQQQIQMMQESIMKRIMELEAEMDHTPLHPKWYREKDYPEPSLEEANRKVTDDQSAHMLLLQRMAHDLDVIGMRSVGVFKNFDERKESKYYDPALAGDFHIAVNTLGSADIYYDVPAKKADDTDEAEKKECALYYWRQEDERLHAESGNSDLSMDEAQMLLAYGRIVTRDILNYDAESWERPFKTALVDPATCFPTWDGDKGLGIMTRLYYMTIGDVIGTWGDKEGKLRNKLLGPKDQDGIRRNLNDSVEVREYWNRRWFGVIVENEWVNGPVEHNLGFVPFTFSIGPLGRSPMTRSPYGNGVSPMEGYAFTTGYQAREEYAEQGLSYIHFMKLPHQAREAVMGKFLTETSRSGNPPLIIEQDDFAYRMGPPRISNAEGARNRIVMGREKVGPFPTAPTPQVVTPLMSSIVDSYNKWAVPVPTGGNNAQQSAMALERIENAGEGKLAAFIKVLTMHHRRQAERRLTMLRDWGWQIGSKDHEGAFLVPSYQKGGGRYRMVELTHGMIRRTGVTVKVRMTSLKLQNLGPLGNAVSLWKNMGLMEDVEALQLRDVNDPEATLRRIDVQEIKKLPEFRRARMLQIAKQEGGMELYHLVRREMMKDGAGDPDANAGGGRWTPQGPGGAQPGASPAGGNGLPGAGPTPANPVGFQGAQMGAFGSPPGQMGGRPPLPPGGGGAPPI